MEIFNSDSSYIILQKNGHNVGQSVSHAHFHYIPKKLSKNKYAAFGLLWDFIWEQFKSPMKQKDLNECVQKMYLAI